MQWEIPNPTVYDTSSVLGARWRHQDKINSCIATCDPSTSRPVLLQTILHTGGDFLRNGPCRDPAWVCSGHHLIPWRTLLSLPWNRNLLLNSSPDMLLNEGLRFVPHKIINVGRTPIFVSGIFITKTVASLIPQIRYLKSLTIGYLCIQKK